MSEKVTILGQAPSKSNSYKIITIGNHSSLGKTPVLKEYERSFYIQCPIRDKMITGYFKLYADVFFTTQSHDLDNSLKIILDCLQECKVIKNDNRCVEIRARKFIDKVNPRIELLIEEVDI